MQFTNSASAPSVLSGFLAAVEQKVNKGNLIVEMHQQKPLAGGQPPFPAPGETDRAEHRETHFRFPGAERPPGPPGEPLWEHVAVAQHARSSEHLRARDADRLSEFPALSRLVLCTGRLSSFVSFWVFQQTQIEPERLEQNNYKFRITNGINTNLSGVRFCAWKTNQKCLFCLPSPAC